MRGKGSMGLRVFLLLGMLLFTVFGARAADNQTIIIYDLSEHSSSSNGFSLDFGLVFLLVVVLLVILSLVFMQKLPILLLVAALSCVLYGLWLGYTVTWVFGAIMTVLGVILGITGIFKIMH